MLKWVSFFVSLLISAASFAQSEEILLLKAEGYFAERQFKQAAGQYNRYLAISRDPKALSYFNAAVANYESGAFEKAERYFRFIEANQLYPSFQTQFYLGLISHAQAKYETAIRHFKNVLKDDKHKYQDLCKKLILQCRTAMKIKDRTSYAFVENLGQVLNSSYDDMAPVPSPNFEGRIYFSSNRSVATGGKRDQNGLPDETGTYAFDIFKSDQQEGIWTSPRPFNDLLNSPRNEVLYDFTGDGQVAFLFRGLNMSYGEILTDTFRQGVALKVQSPQFNAPADAAFGDRDLFFLNDTTLVFAAVMEGGYGGYDLYISFLDGGIWSQPRNLGATVNSAYHDVSPYVDGKGNLFFSSDRVDGLGGYDVFFSPWTAKGWLGVKNMRSGINSSADDLYFRRGSDSYSAYFSSNRKGGYGGLDLYSAYFKEPFGGEMTNYRSEIFRVYGNTSPQVAQHSDVKSKEKWIIRPLLFQEGQEVLSVDQEEVLDVMAKRLKGQPDLKLNILSFSDYTGPRKYDLYFSMKRGELCMQYLVEQGVEAQQLNVIACGSQYPLSINSARPGAQASMNLNRRVHFKFSGAESADIVYDHMVSKELLENTPFYQFWDLIEGLSFSVQIAATQQLYEGSAINTYQNPLLHTQTNNPTLKYTLGIFERYEEARNLRYRLIKDGYQGAFITAYIDGIRRTRGELRQLMDQYSDLEAYINVE